MATLAERLGTFLTEPVWANQPGLTPQDVERRRQYAEALMGRGMSGEPVTSIPEGLSRLTDALFGGIAMRRAEAAAGGMEAGRVNSLRDVAQQLFGGGSGQSTSVPAAAEPANWVSSVGQVDFGGDQQAFIDAMMPFALEASARTGIDPRIIIAQSAQETGWGAHAPGNNYFGIKSHGQAGGATYGTTEYVNGQPMQISDAFRRYGSMGESVNDYADFMLSNPRYGDMLAAQGLDAQLAALGASGYATDPNYASSVGSIARGIQIPGGGAPAQSAGASFFPVVDSLLNNPSTVPLAEQLILAQLSSLMAGPATAEPTDDMREYEFARQNGYQGTFADWMGNAPEPAQPDRPVITGEQAAVLNLDPGKSWQLDQNGNWQEVGDNPLVVIDQGTADFGTIPSGWARVADESSPTGYRLVPEPGGVAEAEVARYEAGVAQERASQLARSNIVLEDIDAAIGKLDDNELLAGWSGQRLLDLGYTAAVDLKNLLSTITSSIGIERIIEMKEASPTGATGFGALNLTELSLLLAQLGSLDQAQSADQLRRNLTRVRELYSGLVEALRTEAGMEEPATPSAAPSSGGIAPAASPAPSAGGIPTVTTAEQYNALPAGAQYRDPEGNLRVKGGN